MNQNGLWGLSKEPENGTWIALALGFGHFTTIGNDVHSIRRILARFSVATRAVEVQRVGQQRGGHEPALQHRR
jgi:hypothetical protein